MVASVTACSGIALFTWPLVAAALHRDILDAAVRRAIGKCRCLGTSPTGHFPNMAGETLEL